MKRSLFPTSSCTSLHANKNNLDRNTVIDTLQQRGGFITTGEVKSRGEYENQDKILRLRHKIESI